MEVLKNYINGEWVPSSGTKTLDVVNPATLELLAKVPLSTKEDVDAAVKAAKEAFWEWRCTPPLTRSRYLFEYRNLLDQNFERIAETIVKEHGKTLDEARGDIKRGIETVELACGVPSLMLGTIEEDAAKEIDEACVKEPLGVCVGLTPYNFPAMIPLWFLPMAVACGNTFILKPSSQVPITAKILVELAEEAGFPPGVVNLLHGSRDVSNALLESPDVKAVSFVGSSPVAKHIYTKSAQNGKRAQCQGQAKNFIIVMPDANIEKTVSALITSVCGCAGQRCLAGEVIVPVGDIYEPLRDAYVEAARKLRVGYGLDPETQMGPLASKEQCEKVKWYIQKGVEEGAKLLLDGRQLKVEKYPNGFFVGPTVLDEVKPGTTVFKDEIFGPVACISRAQTLDEAIKMANTSIYGNAASIFTSSGKAAREFAYKIEAGNVGINIGVPAPIAFFPFAGWKDSFYGDLHGQAKEGIDFYTQDKVLITRWF
ncbi:MAG: CoA-acylating methylmalonate-semialdehyde dehydrogenase [Candidatus Methanomethylicia archaeon]|nr:CoA-acylating methylmalonate-semialdehyde dehydrogenase [Candidatus Methanomethylicia archaeon]